jgi:hypothetical protein
MISQCVKSNRGNLSEYLANIKKRNGQVLLDPLCFINLRQ